MSSENVVSAILTASITGAGLILAIYALITPISSRMFEERRDRLRKKIKEFDELKQKITSESPKKDIEQLKTLGMEIKQIRTFPKYLGPGVLAVFTLYILAALFAFAILVNPVENDSREPLMFVVFLLSTLGFLAIGVYAIQDVYFAMKGEFEQVQKEKREVEKEIIKGLDARA